MEPSIESSGTSQELAAPEQRDGGDIEVRDAHPPVSEGTSDRLLKDATARDWLGSNADPDVLLSVPHLGVDEITFELRDLRAHVNLDAQVLDLVKINVGADVSLGEVNLRIAGVRAQAMLKVRLDNVVTIVDGVVQLLDHHPEIVTSLTSGLGDALREVGTGVGSGVHEIGSGAGDALRGIGTGLGNALDPSHDVERRHTVSYHQAPQRLVADGDDGVPEALPERRVVPQPVTAEPPVAIEPPVAVEQPVTAQPPVAVEQPVTAQPPVAVEQIVERTVESGRPGVDGGTPPVGSPGAADAPPPEGPPV